MKPTMREKQRAGSRELLRGILCAAVIAMPGIAAAAQGVSAGTPAGSLTLPESVMDAYCITQVSPDYPSGLPALTASATVVLRVMIRRSGAVSPISAEAGPHALEMAAMDAARLWRYKPYFRGEGPVDVTTEIQVQFVPGRPGGLITHPGK